MEFIPHVQVVQIVLIKSYCGRLTRPRSALGGRPALVRDALREHLQRLELRAVKGGTGRVLAAGAS